MLSLPVEQGNYTSSSLRVEQGSIFVMIVTESMKTEEKKRALKAKRCACEMHCSLIVFVTVY